MAPFAEAAERLETIPGVGQQAAEVIVAEIGHGHGAVPDGRPPGVVGGAVPGQRRERRQAAERQDDQGEPVAADDAGAGGVGGQPHQGDDLQRDCYRRWAKRLGKKKALVAVAHKILVVIYCLLKNHTDYRERWASPKVA